ncbi:hypothetical protein F4776DRAFT_673849 [Hypoxylon sp. NC0597]|nr:hypothetical protein F4776DRAFT_673849 [Hypoxylon sp. NC0597]
MPTNEIFNKFLGALRGFGPPLPSYHELQQRSSQVRVVKLPKPEYYHRMAKSFIKQHQYVSVWFIPYEGERVDSDVLPEYIEALALGNPLEAGLESYVHTVLDEYRVFTQHVDFLASEAGLSRAFCAEDYASLNPCMLRWCNKTQQEEVYKIRDYLIRKLGWWFGASIPHLPFLYLATRVYETERNGWRRRELLLRTVNLLDKRVMLLRIRHDWLVPETFLEQWCWWPEQMDFNDKYQLLVAEAKNGNHNFQDVIEYEKYMKNRFNLSDEFLDELFGPLVGQKTDPKTDDPKTDDPKTDDSKTDDPKTGDSKSGSKCECGVTTNLAGS